MYLKKLEIFGFKSFADRTDFQFKPGITSIVGPNGCGKSNVVDAFKWIFGSQSAKGLRGSEMKDIIFNGTQTRKPAGYAEVTVVFDNEDRFLDIDYAEVAITRRLFRSGESEYLINKQKCRLKDIRELFLDTGVGTTSYSILEQGKIDVLLQSSPHERRLIFEEAAGISKFRVKKAETVRALLRVEDNLNRLQDIIDEVEKRIRRVKSQAAKARKYKEISDRLKELRIRLALEEFHSSVESRTELSFRLYWASQQLEALEGLEHRLDDGLEKQLTNRSGLQEDLRELRQKLSVVTSTKERVQERIENSRRRLQELAEEKVRKQEDLEDTLENVERLRGEIEAEREKLETVQLELETAAERVDELESSVEDVRAAHGEKLQGLEERRTEIVGIIQRRSRIANLLVQVASELKNLGGRKERLENALSGFRLELEEIAERRGSLEQDSATLGEKRESLSAERERLSALASEIESSIDLIETELAEQKESLHRKSSRLEVLRSFEERLDGVATGVAEILKRREELPAEARSYGLVGSLVDVERKYSLAVEAALGDRSQALALESHEGALQLLKFAQDREVGAVQVIALERVDYIEPHHFPRCAGVLGRLRDTVRVDADYEDLFDRLLANVVLVEDLRTAMALSRNGLRPFRLVTLAGEVVEPWGGFSIPGEASRGIVSRRSEMNELEKEVGALEGVCAQLQEQLSSERTRLDECRAKQDETNESFKDVDRRITTLEADLSQVEKESHRLQRETGVSQSELAEVSEESQKREAEKLEREKEATQVDEEQEALQAGIRELEAEVEASAREVQTAVESLQQARLERAQLEQQTEGAKELVAQRGVNLEEREGHCEDVKRDLGGVDRRAKESEEVVSDSARELEEVVESEGELGEALGTLEAEEERYTEIERAFRREIDAVRQRAGRFRQEQGELQLRDQEERHRRNTILERIDEQYGIDLGEFAEKAAETLARREARAAEKARLLELAEQAAESEEVESEDGEGEEARESTELVEPSEDADSSSVQALTVQDQAQGNAAAQTTVDEDAAEAGVDGETEDEEEEEVLGDERFLLPLEDWNRDEAHKEARSLADQLRKLGNVNLEALEEIEELEDRFEFQKAQKTDLDESQQRLQSIINDINRKSRELFEDTFARVQTNFAELFRKSFGGGRAELLLEQGEDVLEGGIEIVARPPGKKLTSLSLMSGGEKTMTTIALLLAIFRSRPSPFCILDEVDAPLDDANVRRYVVLLKDFIERSQFLIITHNKVTMAEASSLYGVTMQERGVSKRVAVELENYDPEEMELAAR